MHLHARSLSVCVCAVFALLPARAACAVANIPPAGSNVPIQQNPLTQIKNVFLALRSHAARFVHVHPATSSLILAGSCTPYSILYYIESLLALEPFVFSRTHAPNTHRTRRGHDTAPRNTHRRWIEHITRKYLHIQAHTQTTPTPPLTQT